MIIVADSGSTKADWRIASANGQVSKISTRGFNPFLHSADFIESTLKNEFINHISVHQVDKVFYYGAGCSDAFRCEIVTDAMKRLFPNAMIYVDHDLLAAARATCKDQPGIACIMGTGSNSCAYDGIKIIDNVTNMGHILGDEGSGYHLGKLLIQAYFYREFPADFQAIFEQEFPQGKRDILNNIYGGDANLYLSSYARFIAEHKSHPFIQQLVGSAFDDFLKRHVCKYANHEQLPVSFIGSIAYHFKKILANSLQRQGLTMGTIVHKPISELLSYHLQQEQISTGD